MTQISLRIKEIREALGISQARLSALSGVRQATISKLEAGGGCNLTTLAQLADALGVDASVLIVHKARKR